MAKKNALQIKHTITDVRWNQMKSNQYRKKKSYSLLTNTFDFLQQAAWTHQDRKKSDEIKKNVDNIL